MLARKAQVQAITMVLMAGVVISLVGAAWFWGKPLIEKRSTATEIATAEEFIIELDRQIVEVARSGGSKSVRIPSIAGASLYVNDTQLAAFGNEVTFSFTTDQAMIEMGGDSASVPVETFDENHVGSYGGSPRIITLDGNELSNSQFRMTLRLRYRQLDDTTSDRGYQIVLNDGGRVTDRAASMVTVTFLGTETISGDCCSGAGDTLETKINVSIS
ncbi:MAG: hypothetical protein JW789_02275 [Candidatus Aenigmarchaeota archaeon]|nr:hypothetical protein [Candidatus Aenigmarchaeota archaeon]